MQYCQLHSNKTFSETVGEMRKFHLDVERQMISFDRIVPIAQNPENVYSPRLYNILQAASAQVIAMMEIISNECRLDVLEATKTDVNKGEGRRQKKFHHYFELLNKDGALEIQKLAIRGSKRIVAPFKQSGQNAPEWWQAYNDTKHDLPQGAYLGTLGNTVNALGGLAILHYIVTASITHSWGKLAWLKKDNWKDKQGDIFTDLEQTEGYTQGIPWTVAVAERRNYAHRSKLFYHLMEL